MASLFPGEFGWQRTLTEDGSPPAGRVLCFLLPGASSDRESPNSPLPGVDRASFSYVVTLSGPPWRILAALSPSGASSGPLREFAEAVARELRSE